LSGRIGGGPSHRSAAGEPTACVVVTARVCTRVWGARCSGPPLGCACAPPGVAAIWGTTGARSARRQRRGGAAHADVANIGSGLHPGRFPSRAMLRYATDVYDRGRLALWLTCIYSTACTPQNGHAALLHPDGMGRPARLAASSQTRLPCGQDREMCVQLNAAVSIEAKDASAPPSVPIGPWLGASQFRSRALPRRAAAACAAAWLPKRHVAPKAAPPQINPRLVLVPAAFCVINAIWRILPAPLIRHRQGGHRVDSTYLARLAQRSAGPPPLAQAQHADGAATAASATTDAGTPVLPLPAAAEGGSGAGTTLKLGARRGPSSGVGAHPEAPSAALIPGRPHGCGRGYTHTEPGCLSSPPGEKVAIDRLGPTVGAPPPPPHDA
jgi:hypothetical protein